jgi:hypothetical protein
LEPFTGIERKVIDMAGASNLPAGVTGNEYQIAGAQYEADHVMECDAEQVQIVSISGFGQQRIERALELIRENADKPARELHSYLLTAMDEINKVDLEVCPFVGNVTVYRPGAEEWWRCPLCTTDHRDEYIPEDPNDG